MDEKLRILLCEDDENLGMLLREYLQAKGYSAELCPDGEAGYKAFLKNKYDLCVLDVMMPKKDGFTLAQEIRQANAQIPIIFLTAKTMKEDILEGFKIGADQCTEDLRTLYEEFDLGHEIQKKIGIFKNVRLYDLLPGTKRALVDVVDRRVEGE